MHIFYCADGKFGEVAGVFSLEKHSADAGRGGTKRCAYASGVLSVPDSVRVRHRTLGTRRRLNPACVSGAA